MEIVMSNVSWAVLLLMLYAPMYKRHLNHVEPERLKLLIYYNISKYAHSFWRGNFGRKQLFSIKSFITTIHTKWTTYLWVDQYINFSKSAREQLPKLGIVIKKFIWEKETIGTPFELLKKPYPWLDKRYAGDRRGVIYSDWARLVFLYKYGGVYFDLDIFFIQPMEDIVAKYGQFIVPWEHFKEKTNNCFMFFYRKSKEITEVAEKAVIERKSASIFGLSALTRPHLSKNIIVLPACVVDFCWGCKICDNSRWVFTKIRPTLNGKDIYEGVFEKQAMVYHWHNGYDMKITNESYIARYEMVYDTKLGFIYDYSAETS